MKKKVFLVPFLLLWSCVPNMEADANRACELMSETKELMPQIMKLSMQSAFGTETEMREAADELSSLEVKFEEIGKEMEKLSSSYDEVEFQKFLLDNCEAAREMKDMGEALESLGEID